MARNESKPKVSLSAADVEEINSICQEFTTRYYDALQAIPDAWPLKRFYNESSKHIHLRFGQRPEVTLGLEQIVRFVAKMKFVKCNFAINSMCAKRPWPTRFTVDTVGELSHPGLIAARKFTQSTVFVRFPPSKSSNTRRQYLILKTVFKFVDRVNDDQFFPAANDPPKKDGRPTAKTTDDDVAKESPEKSSPAVTKTTVAVHIPSVWDDNGSSEKHSTSDKKVETPGQSTVLKNTKPLEPTKEEPSKNVILTPDEKSTVPKKRSKKMRKNADQSIENGQQAKRNANETTKPPEKCSKKTKTKYVKFCEIPESKVSNTDNIAETDKSLKPGEKDLIEKQETAKVNYWHTRMSLANTGPSAIANVAPKDDSITTKDNKPALEIQCKKAQKVKETVQTKTEQPRTNTGPPAIANVAPKDDSIAATKDNKPALKIQRKKAQKAKQTTKTEQPRTNADDADTEAGEWQIKTSRKKKSHLPGVAETAKDQSAAGNKENKKFPSDFPPIGSKGKPKTLEKNKLASNKQPVKAKETSKRR